MSELLERIDLRFDHVASKLAEHTISDNGCWEYQRQISSSGYGKFDIYSRQHIPHKKKFSAHRVSYAFHYGVDPGALCVCHLCDNPRCINPDHLFLGTNADNTRDMIGKGRAARQDGELNGANKLDTAKVEQIVDLITQGQSNKQIAESVGMHHAAISLIRLGKTWRNVTKSLGYNPEDHRRFHRKRPAQPGTRPL